MANSRINDLKYSSQISNNGWDGAIPPEEQSSNRQATVSPTASSGPKVPSKYKAKSLDPLLPSFKAKIVQLISNMEALGFDPLPISTGRTPAEAAANAQKGTGIVNSLHIYGAAVDFISASKGWSDPLFYVQLGISAEALGLIWGGRFTKEDLPHVQAVAVKYQNQIRNISNFAARDSLVSSLLVA